MRSAGLPLFGKARGNWLLALLKQIRISFLASLRSIPGIFLAPLKYVHSKTPPYLKSPLGRFLAYEWERRSGDNQFLAFLKFICNWLLVYFPLLFLLRLIQRLSSDEPWYPIEDEIVLTTTRVIFTRSKRNTQSICLKLWQRSSEKARDDGLITRSEGDLLEGLAFNRKFAKDVYLGVAPVTLIENKKIRRGHLIENPEKLDQEVEYALVMRRLNEHWRLDNQLHQSGRVKIDFLAREVAYMHWQLEKSPDEYGTPDCISSKLKLNSELFSRALKQLSNGLNNVEQYGWISNLLTETCEDNSELFMQRYRNGHIKRCHGDLKATNLWVRPGKTLPFGLKNSPQQLLALDCIDFNPEFCHIDTLSDIAMLAIDIEMHLTHWTDPSKYMEYGQNFANVFLDCYLRETEESSIDAWPLLRYYMTEKAMVCAYVSILYDKQPELGAKYLEIALAHAQQLGKLVEPFANLSASVVS